MTFPGLGGQQPPPQNSAPAGQLTPGVTPGVSGQVVARRVIIAGPGGELLVYSPSPGAGSLVASTAAGPGTDPFGNAYLGGVASYTGSGAVWFANSLLGGDLAYFASSSSAGPWTLTTQISVNSAGFVLLQTGTSSGSWPQSGGAGITTVAQLVTVLENLGLLTP